MTVSVDPLPSGSQQLSVVGYRNYKRPETGCIGVSSSRPPSIIRPPWPFTHVPIHTCPHVSPSSTLRSMYEVCAPIKGRVTVTVRSHGRRGFRSPPTHSDICHSQCTTLYIYVNRPPCITLTRSRVCVDDLLVRNRDDAPAMASPEREGTEIQAGASAVAGA